MDIFDADAREEWTECTGLKFTAKNPGDRPTFEYVSTLEPTESDAKERMIEAINLSWTPLEPVQEPNSLRSEAKTLLKYICKDPAEALAEIPPLERKLIDLYKKQIDHELHDSYWEEYSDTGTKNSLDVAKSSPWFYDRNESKMNVTIVDSQLRQLQSFTGDDYIMLGELRDSDRPSRLTTCVDGETLTGFQVWYGEYDEIAGSANGDLSTECTNTLINQEIWKVIFYGSADGKTYI